MKRTFIAIIVGAIIIFIYQAMSWMVLPVHKNSLKYTPAHDSLLAVLNSSLPEEGLYMLPMAPPEMSQEEHEKFFEPYYGKPWAKVTFHKAMTDSMTSMMMMGFIFNLVAIWIVVVVLNKTSGVFNTFGSRLWVVLGFSMFTIFQSHLMEWNWWQSPSHYIVPEIIDDLLGGLLVGLWLAWYLGRAPKEA